jgi:hypothetical protein
MSQSILYSLSVFLPQFCQKKLVHSAICTTSSEYVNIFIIKLTQITDWRRHKWENSCLYVTEPVCPLSWSLRIVTWEKYECHIFFAVERYAVYNNSFINYHFIILSLSLPRGVKYFATIKEYSFISTLISSSCCPNTFLSAVLLYLMPGINFASYK